MDQPTTIPPSLKVIKRGAAIDWKATALDLHERLEQALHGYDNAVSARTDVLNRLSREQSDHLRTQNYLNRAEAQLAGIRKHWTAMFLPSHLRRGV